MTKSKIEINLLRDMYAKALYRACKDTRAYKYLLFSKWSGLQNDGCDINVEDVRWFMLTEKVRHTIDMWIRLSMARRNSTHIQLNEDDMMRVDSYNVPTGNIAKLINFTGKVGITTDLAENGKCLVETEYQFNLEGADTLRTDIETMFVNNKGRETEAAAKTLALKVTQYADKLMPALSATTLDGNYKTINGYCKFSVDKVAKKHAKLGDFAGFKAQKYVHTIEGLTDVNFSIEAVAILNIESPFKMDLDEITEDLVAISEMRKIDWISDSFKESV